MGGNKSNYTNLRCLIVDDFEMIRSLIRTGLSTLGVQQIVEATDGEAALQILHESKANNNKFDLVFSDWNMPKMNGIDLLVACKSDQQLNNIHFIMVTSEGERQAILDAVKNGADDYIVKPFTANLIQGKVEKLMEKMGR